ncbi:MAG: class I SAM-dependent methyltransferase [Desulfobulbaceae bacterium]|nr:class I SAM-dependent methyltransferase [Desulfobulbaceae bacterium]
MPDLNTNIHLDMFAAGKRKRSFAARLKKAIMVLRGKDDIYGLEWGDPETNPPLQYVRDHFLLPYISADKTVVEIGPGGGRWTRYMLSAKRIYAVDYHPEILNELKANITTTNIVPVTNSGDDFPSIPEGSIDFLFSFGTFVHLDLDIIDRYLKNIKPLLKAEGEVVIQYADFTKPLAQTNEGFSNNDPDKMRQLVKSHGYVIKEEDVKTMWHSSIIRFGRDHLVG